jgi:hypothetical protein
MVLLCAAYVFGCAFRSILPRADVQRIVLFNTWLSSVLVGRTVATVAEVCFVIQWAIVLRLLANHARSDTGRNIALLIVPLILVAEACSWYAVITTSYLGNAIENSIWTVTFLLIAVALVRLLFSFHGLLRGAIAVAIAGVACYVAFLVAVDVPMYFERWQEDVANGKPLLGMFAGLYDMSTRWLVTHDFAHWQDEIPWMSLYFSAAVWSSLALCSFGLIADQLHHAAPPGDCRHGLCCLSSAAREEPDFAHVEPPCAPLAPARRGPNAHEKRKNWVPAFADTSGENDAVAAGQSNLMFAALATAVYFGMSLAIRS